jgi:hypothetical protein
MDTILVIFTINTDNLPTNFQEIIQYEKEMLAEWKSEGLVEHLFLRSTRNGAVIVFKNIDETKAEELMKSLPLYPFVKSVEYLSLMKEF